VCGDDDQGRGNVHWYRADSGDSAVEFRAWTIAPGAVGARCRRVAVHDAKVSLPGTSVWNFEPQFGVGAHYFLNDRHSIDFGAQAIHISNASLADRNSGVNALVQFQLGYTWWKKK